MKTLEGKPLGIRILFYATLVIYGIVPSLVFAAEKRFPILEAVESVSTVPVTYSGVVTLIEPQQCSDLSAVVEIHLNDLFSKMTKIVKASGVEKNDKCGNKVAINSVNMRGENDNLVVDVNALVGRQECIRTKVPEFRGLKLTMKTRVVASRTFKTSVRMVTVFKPVLSDFNKALSMSLVSAAIPQINSENDRFLISDINLRDAISKQVVLAMNSSWVADRALSPLPSQIAKLGFTMKHAAVVNSEAGPMLQVRGSFPLPQSLRPTILDSLGFNGELCP